MCMGIGLGGGGGGETSCYHNGLGCLGIRVVSALGRFGRVVSAWVVSANFWGGSFRPKKVSRFGPGSFRP